MTPATDPLAQLRDIHEPAAVGWWPPAPGWWILAVLLLSIIVLGIYYGLQRWRSGAYRRRARRDIEQHFERWEEDRDSQRFLQQLNQVLKRTALASFSREEIASLSGEQWCTFLDEKAATAKGSFVGGPLANLYSAEQTPDGEEVEAVKRLALDWTARHRCSS